MPFPVREVLESFLWRSLRIAAAAMMTAAAAMPARAQSRPAQAVDDHAAKPLVTAQPPTSDEQVARYDLDPSGAPVLPHARMAALVRRNIRYVFVIFNENESFDHEYGTFPGADGLYSDGRHPRSPADTPGFIQHYVDRAGRSHEVRPFLVGPAQNATVSDSVDHSHIGLAAKLDVTKGVARMDGFAQVEYGGKAGRALTVAADGRGKQFANLVMSHVDCDTIPFFWQYANRFTLFDDIFATEDTPSTPNAVAMIAGQGGETQWVKHGSAGTTQRLADVTINGTTYGPDQIATTQGPPLLGDPQPYWGSQFDPTKAGREPTGPHEIFAPSNIASNLTFANVLLTLSGTGIHTILSADRHAASNQADIQADIPAIFAAGKPARNWGWYENGYDHEPYDGRGTTSHYGFASHHDGPQYFGYLADNPNEQRFMHGEGDFFADIRTAIPAAGSGVYYIRGGYQNLQGLRSALTNRRFPANARATGGLTGTDIATIQTVKVGDDDHPAYSDHAIAEAMNATVINAIAANERLWSQSAIIITYDESDGFYDHVPPRILAYGPDGLPLSRGIRVPLLVISPYARTHVVSHAEGDHNAVIETINAIFDLPALSSLPDEAAALAAGDSAAFNRFAGPDAPPGFTQKFLGPRDTNSAITDSLLSAFDPRRLEGTAPPLPASYAMIPEARVLSLPHDASEGCKAIGVVPEDRRQGIAAPPPATYNSLPSTLSKYNIPAPE